MSALEEFILEKEAERAAREKAQAK